MENNKTIIIVDYKGFRVVIPLKEMMIEPNSGVSGKAYEEFMGTNTDTDMKFYCVGYTPMRYYMNGYQIGNLEGHKAKTIAADLIATFLPEDVVEDLGDFEKTDGSEGNPLPSTDPMMPGADMDLTKENTDLSAHEIAEKALHIAASICVYTNDNIIVEDV